MSRNEPSVITRSVKFKVRGNCSEQMHAAVAAVKGAFEEYSKEGFEAGVQYELKFTLGKDV